MSVEAPAPWCASVAEVVPWEARKLPMLRKVVVPATTTMVQKATARFQCLRAIQPAKMTATRP